MAFKPVADLDCDTAYALGGINKETKKPNPTKVEGYYIGSKTTESKFGPSKLHVFQTAKGNHGVFGKTNLDAKMATVAPGTMVRVTLNGTVPTNKGNDMIKFKVEVDEDNTIEVNAASENSDDAETSYEEASNEETYEEEENYEAEETEEEAAPARAKAPAKTASTPDAAHQRKVQELLGKANRRSVA